MTETPSQPTADVARLRISRDAAPVHDAPSRRGLWIALAILVIVGGAVALLLARPRAVEVRVATVSTTGGGAITGEGISANGYVVARTKASVSAKTFGRLEYLGVQEGSRVKRGEVIARIESDTYRAAHEAARAAVTRAKVELEQGRRDLERARKLQAENVLSTADLEDAQTRVGLLEAQLGSANAALNVELANLENTRVRAPFDGTILRKDAEVGEIVAPSAAGGGLTRTAIVTMADLGTLEVEVDVNEAYIARIANGQDGRVTLDAYPDTSFQARVRQIVPTADRQKATVLVKVAILDSDPRILPEMGAKVVFLKGGEAAAVAVPTRVLVPAAAVARDGASIKVWVVVNGKLAARSVTLGRERGDQIEVEQGLTGGETVVLEPTAALKEGLGVRVRTS